MVTTASNRQPAHRRHAAWLMLLAGAVLAGGCSLETYEKSLEKSQKYLGDVDNENQNCANPIDLPEKPKQAGGGSGGKPGAIGATPGPGSIPGPAGGAPAAGPPTAASLLGAGAIGVKDYFFRPPKGIAPKGELREVGKDNVIYVFKKEPPPPPPKPIAATDPLSAEKQFGVQPKPEPVIEQPTEGLYFALKRGGTSKKEFMEQVLASIQHGGFSGQPQNRVVIGLSGKSLTYEELIDVPKRVHLYFLGPVQSGVTEYFVAIAFVVSPQKTKPDSEMGQRFEKQKVSSLMSLALGKDAEVRHKSYKPR